ncbi:hypothetical protein [Streptomyces sp. 2A115]|uniref:hypothetical protein n=1 Tax=Streptomyces sp. 2A115 TaxID=3457439 RepID=UPI003FD3919E
MIRTELVGSLGPYDLSVLGDGFLGPVQLAFRARKPAASNLDYDVPFIQPGTLLPGTR